MEPTSPDTIGFNAHFDHLRPRTRQARVPVALVIQPMIIDKLRAFPYSNHPMYLAKGPRKAGTPKG
jgi:hypothetical protein